MSKISIYSPSDVIIHDAPIKRGAKEVCKLMEAHYIELSFDHSPYLAFTSGCYILHNDRKYYLLKNAAPEPMSEASGYTYNLKFYARQHLMENCALRWLDGFNEEVTFNLTTTLEEYAKLLVANMNAYMDGVDDVVWSYRDIPAEYADVTKAVTFEGVNCWDGINTIAEEFGVEWWTEELTEDSGRYIFLCFGRCSIGEYVDIRENEIVNHFPAARRGEDENFGTRFYIYGGTKNIPEGYYEDTTGGVTNHVSQKRLHLPLNLKYLTADATLTGTQIIEKVVILDDIFPRNTETVTEVFTAPREIIEGEENTAYIIEASGTAFDPSSMKIGTLGVTFTSGALMGRSFDVDINDDKSGQTFDKKFELIAQVEGVSGSSQIIIPNEYLKPEAGDTFILTGVELPQEKVDEAETELRLRGSDIVNQYYADTNVYDIVTNPVYCNKNSIQFALGQKVRLVGAHFGNDGRISRVQGYEKVLYDPYQATYNIGDNRTYSKRLSEIHKLEHLQKNTNEQVVSLGSNNRTLIQILSTGSNSIGTQLAVLIGDDYWMSAREIASDEAMKVIPTEVATATQRINMRDIITPVRLLSPNVMYDWSGISKEALTIPNLGSGDAAYDNKWMVRFSTVSSDNVTIPFDVMWKDGVAPSWSEWVTCQMTFTKDGIERIMGEWKIFK